jgi:hypothetical protein
MLMTVGFLITGGDEFWTAEADTRNRAIKRKDIVEL